MEEEEAAREGMVGAALAGKVKGVGEVPATAEVPRGRMSRCSEENVADNYLGRCKRTKQGTPLSKRD